jgi:tetratricopeptide (TPR) repeat protein
LKINQDSPSNRPALTAVICLALVAMVWIVFGQTAQYGFINFDDDVYIYDNPMVLHGLTLSGIKLAFTQFVGGNWHPMTMLSLMTDCHFYGLDPAGHHLVNILLHTMAVVLLFVVLKNMTASLWRSAIVAALFAIHPHRVESVAWLAERKDVLSAFFFMLTLCAYAWYVRQPGIRRYLSVALFMTLGLMSKPVLITVPLVLLILDYWPLRRFTTDVSNAASLLPCEWMKTRSIVQRLVIEKIPLFAISFCIGLATIVAQRSVLAIDTSLPLPLRLSNALVSYVKYIEQALYPSNLALFYPYPIHGIALWKVAGALLILALISAGAIFARRKCPALLAGWLWYLVMLIPVIGILQAGDQAMADRHTYFPEIGLFCMAVFGLSAGSSLSYGRRVLLGSLAVLVIGGLLLQARVQASYWRDNKTLWRHSLACTTGNYVAHNNLGRAFFKARQFDEAMAEFQIAEQLSPEAVQPHYNIGNVLIEKGQLDRGIAELQKALELNPRYVMAHIDLAGVLARKGQVDLAVQHLRTAIELKPNYFDAHNNLGNFLMQQGRFDEAIDHYRVALEIKPESSDIHGNLAAALFQNGRVDEAITHFQEAVKLAPADAGAHYNCGMALLQKARFDEAATQFEKVVEIQPNDADAERTLGEIYERKGQRDLAITHLQKAQQIAANQNNSALVKMLDQRLKFLKSGESSRPLQPPSQASP